jgi:CRP/FNR family transcriptional regulator, anaerobic regulatory protein
MEEVLSFLNELAKAEGWKLSRKCIGYLKNHIKRKSLKQGEYLLVAGEVCENLYFIKKGLLKCYYILRGNQVCDWFFGEMETVVAVDSFYDQVRSVDYVQVLEDCELLYISFDELNFLYRNFVEFNAVGRVLTYKYFRIWHRQSRNLRMLSKEERYRLLITTQPDLINRVPVQDLASFLDMSKGTLSRMRKRIQ